MGGKPIILEHNAILANIYLLVPNNRALTKGILIIQIIAQEPIITAEHNDTVSELYPSSITKSRALKVDTNTPIGTSHVRPGQLVLVVEVEEYGNTTQIVITSLAFRLRAPP